jgi:hypothetical protein
VLAGGAIAAAVAPAAAEPGSPWVALGPYGATVRALAIDPSRPSVMYAATSAAGGVWKSRDGGMTWAGAFSGLPQFGAAALAIDPRNTSTLYVSFPQGVFKSIDGGVNWSATGTGLLPGAGALAIDPSHPQTVYVANGTGLAKSTDGGAAWAPAQSGLPSAGGVLALAIDPSAPQTIYAGVAAGGNGSAPAGTHGVFKSIDGGASWQPAGATSPPVTIAALAIAPGAPQTVYAGGKGGIYKSLNGGASWTPSFASASDLFRALAIDPGPVGTVYAGSANGFIGASADGGGNWSVTTPTSPSSPLQSVLALAIDPAGSGTIYAGTASGVTTGGVYKSGDRGATWTSNSFEGVATTDLDGLVVSRPGQAVAPDFLFATTAGQLVGSPEGGVTWTSAALPNVPFLSGDEVLQFASDPVRLYLFAVDVVIAAGHASVGLFEGGLGGWGQLPNPLANLGWVAIDPQDDNILYLGSPLVRSADGGATWTGFQGSVLPAANLAPVLIDPLAPTNVYAWANASSNLYKSTDRGLTWSLAGATLGSLDVLRVDTSSPATLYAAAGGYVEKSTDGGASWQVVYIPADPVHHGASWIAVAPVVESTMPATVYAVLAGAGVVRSADRGVTWSALPTGGLGGAVKSLEVDPQDPWRLIANVAGAGAWAMTVPALPGPCVAGAGALCLDGGRFQVAAGWQTTKGAGGAATLELTPDTGALWFFKPENLELLVKVLDGCALNGRWWVFAGGLTNVGVTLTVTDTQTGEFRTYTSPIGVPFAPLQDTTAFANCP